jgi:DNA-directed RNA polymerase specialized sigma24 family protein
MATPSDDSDFAVAFFERYGTTLAAAAKFMYVAAIRVTAGSKVEPPELVNSFVVDRLAESVHESTPIDHPFSYLRRSLHNYLIDTILAERRRQRLLEPEMPQQDPPSPEPTPESVAMVAGFWDTVRHRGRLSCQQIRAIELRLDERTLHIMRTFAEVGEGMGCSKDAARRHYSAGIDEVRRIVKTDEGWDGR